MLTLYYLTIITTQISSHLQFFPPHHPQALRGIPQSFPIANPRHTLNPRQLISRSIPLAEDEHIL